MNEERAKFWTILMLAVLTCFFLVIFIDIGIKTQILEESAALRKVLDRERKGQEVRTGFDPNDSFNGSVPVDLLFSRSGRMETGSANNGTQATTATRYEISRPVQDDDPGILSGDK